MGGKIVVAADVPEVAGYIARRLEWAGYWLQEIRDRASGLVLEKENTPERAV